MSLVEEIEAKRQHIRADGYQMSIGEFLNLYTDKEIVIRPEYQRLFRWDIERQSRLIESVLLGIPLPSIFVAERGDGVWEVVDGLQRLSTLFKFMGVLRDEATGEVQEASTLIGTKYLPSLEGVAFNTGGVGPELDAATRIALKRAKLDVKILMQDTDSSIKFELFDRLNSGGQPTSEQEVRSAQLLMVHPEFQAWLASLGSSDDFQSCLPLTTRQRNEQYDLELALRFLVLFYSTRDVLTSFSDFDSLLSDQAVKLADQDAEAIDGGFTMGTAGDLFARTFRVISAAGIDAFRRYDSSKQKFQGGFSVSAFEAVTVGVARNLVEWEAVKASEVGETLLERCASLWQERAFTDRSGAGVRASQRIPHMVELGPAHFGL